MGTTHRFMVASIAVLCSLASPASRDLVAPVRAAEVVAGEAVVPLYIEPTRVVTVSPAGCSDEGMPLRPVWNHIWRFLARQIQLAARWLSSAVLDSSPLRYRSPDGAHEPL